MRTRVVAGIVATGAVLLMQGAYGVHLAAAPPEAEGCEAICTNCNGGGHATIEGGTHTSLHAVALECQSGTCSGHGHSPCAPERPWAQLTSGVESIRAAVAKGDAAAVSELVAALGDALVVVAERRALQASDCGGRVIVNVPLPGDVWNRVYGDAR